MDIDYHMMPEEDNNAEEHVWVDKCLLAAMALIRKAKSLNTEPPEYICLLALCAVSNLHHEAWPLSREQFEKAKPLYEQNLGPDHPRTIAVLHKLALAARHCGDMAVSEKYCRQAWKLYEGRLGPTAAETLNVLNDLASTIELLKEAEVMFPSPDVGRPSALLGAAVISRPVPRSIGLTRSNLPLPGAPLPRRATGTGTDSMGGVVSMSDIRIKAGLIRSRAKLVPSTKASD